MASYGSAAEISVYELSRAGIDPPKSFIRRRNDEEIPTDDSPASNPLPVVDLEVLFSSDEDARICEMERLMSALTSWGLFQVVSHGIPNSMLDDLDELTRQYFDLPKTEKEKFSKAVFKEGDEIDESITEHEILDWHDHLFLQVLPEAERDMSLWPTNPRSFRGILSEYTMKLKSVCENTLKAMGKLLNLGEDYFLKEFDESGTGPLAHVQFNFYPRCPKPDLVHGVKPHTDGCALTILLPDQTVGGLEVCKDGKWIRAQSLPYALIINVGDQMEIMSNGIFKSPLHRVVTNSVKDRISVVMFTTPHVEKEIGPAEGLIDEVNGKPRLYKNLTVQEYNQLYYNNFKQGKRGIDRAKV